MSSVAAAAKARGFTLIELLVVLMIMGILVGLASASVRPDERALLRVESLRLAQLLDLAAAESRYSGKAIAWTAGEGTYRFWREAGDAQGSAQWFEIRDSDPLRARTLPHGMRVAGLRIENAQSRDAPRLEFTPYAPSAAFSIEMALGNARSTVAGSPVGDIDVLPGEGG